MVKPSGFWTAQQKPTGMYLQIEEHEERDDGTIAFWWWMEEAAEETPYSLEITAQGYFATAEEAHEDALDFAEAHNFQILNEGEELLKDAVE